jgi:hypothetical protein
VVRTAGPADKLEQTLANMDGTCVPAIVILYLMMRALLLSFRDSLAGAARPVACRQETGCRGWHAAGMTALWPVVQRFLLRRPGSL